MKKTYEIDVIYFKNCHIHEMTIPVRNMFHPRTILVLNIFLCIIHFDSSGLWDSFLPDMDRKQTFTHYDSLLVWKREHVKVSFVQQRISTVVPFGTNLVLHIN